MKKFFSCKRDNGEKEKLITKEKEETDRLQEEREKAKQNLRDLERLAVERKRVEEQTKKQRLLTTNLMKF